MSSHVTNEQLAIMVEFMERHGDINTMINTPLSRLRRQQLWYELKELLRQTGSGPDKTLEQWVKTWSDVKHRTKRKWLLSKRQMAGAGGPKKRIVLTDLETRIFKMITSKRVYEGSTQESIVELPVSEALTKSSQDIKDSSPSVLLQQPMEGTVIPIEIITSDCQTAPHVSLEDTNASFNESLPGTSSETHQTGSRPCQCPQHPVSSDETFNHAANLFTEIELKRLAFEEEKDRRQYELELKRLELEMFRENNVKQRETALVQLNKDVISLQQEIVQLIREFKPAILNLVDHK